MTASYPTIHFILARGKSSKGKTYVLNDGDVQACTPEVHRTAPSCSILGKSNTLGKKLPKQIHLERIETFEFLELDQALGCD